MNPISPKPEGSIESGNLDETLVAACLPGEAPVVHWAYGMPLSYVHEMATHWLSLFDQTVRITVPVASESTRETNPEVRSD